MIEPPGTSLWAQPLRVAELMVEPSMSFHSQSMTMWVHPSQNCNALDDALGCKPIVEIRTRTSSRLAVSIPASPKPTEHASCGGPDQPRPEDSFETSNTNQPTPHETPHFEWIRCMAEAGWIFSDLGHHR